MPRPEYRDPKKKTVYLEKVDPEVKEDFLDICYKLDKRQDDTFAHIVRTFYEREKVKPRPSRSKKS